MWKAKTNGKKNVTLLEAVLRLQGDFRRRLEPLGVTPLQAGILLYLQRHPGAKVKDTAAALAVQPPTVSAMILTPVRKGWLTKRRVPTDDRSVSLRLTQHGQVLARNILDGIRDMKSYFT
jgi:DNA-binding MarR family transcriptional regulator